VACARRCPCPLELADADTPGRRRSDPASGRGCRDGGQRFGDHEDGSAIQALWGIALGGLAQELLAIPFAGIGRVAIVIELFIGLSRKLLDAVNATTSSATEDSVRID
jgi:hypothetical protein